LRSLKLQVDPLYVDKQTKLLLQEETTPGVHKQNFLKLFLYRQTTGRLSIFTEYFINIFSLKNFLQSIFCQYLLNEQFANCFFFNAHVFLFKEQFIKLFSPNH